MTVEYKVCTKCGESKPATAEFFHRRGKLGKLKSLCKVCACKYKKDMHEKHPAYIRWWSMLKRCCDVKNKHYGGKGVTVCEDWKGYTTFSKWYDANSITGWEIDKDILGGTSYSSEYCVFVPNTINTFFTFKKPPSIRRDYRKYTIKTKIKGKTLELRGDSEEGVLEQFYLFKELYLDKLVWEMKEEHKRLCEKYPNTPQISPKLLSILENFSTREYLEMKSGEGVAY